MFGVNLNSEIEENFLPFVGEKKPATDNSKETPIKDQGESERRDQGKSNERAREKRGKSEGRARND